MKQGIAATSYSYVYKLTLVATLGGLLFGYDTAVISGAVDSHKMFFSLDEATFGAAASFYHGATVSSALIGCIIGSVNFVEVP